MGKMDEMILVAPRTIVFNNEELAFQGININQEITKQIVANLANSYSVMRRGDAEEDPTYKQPIPYVVFRRDNQVFAYRRLTGGGEKRLHNQISIGVGGHANNLDGLDFYELVAENMKREIEEELNIKGEFDLASVGLINDDSNDVGKVHIGLLAIAEVDKNTTISVRETDQLEGFWIDINQIKSEETYSTLETWSQFVADIL